MADEMRISFWSADVCSADLTAINSGQPGYTSCLIPRDVYSENGRVVLMEKGTRVLGEYRGGIQQGQNRLFVLWTRAVTTQGARIDLASPGARSEERRVGKACVSKCRYRGSTDDEKKREER